MKPETKKWIVIAGMALVGINAVKPIIDLQKYLPDFLNSPNVITIAGFAVIYGIWAILDKQMI